MQVLTLHHREPVCGVPQDTRWLAAALSPMGSLRAGYASGPVSPWPRLLAAIAAVDKEAALDIAEGIAREAVPDEDWPHPQRAHIRWEDGAIVFTTPGGVEVQISAGEGGAVVHILFRRESRYLAMLILATLAADEHCDPVQVSIDHHSAADRPALLVEGNQYTALALAAADVAHGEVEIVRVQ